jgi:hypothetical protein
MSHTYVPRASARIKSSFFLWLVLSLFATGAQAFKVNTHVWVGQQVLNDVAPDGRVTIAGREYTVAPPIVEALRQYPGEYRMGNIGPDAFPDVVAGQMTTHPGVTGAWQSDDWLGWVLSGSGGNPQRIAFNYGYVAHAAADVFAHSYVNTYSGGVFWLMDDGEGTEQEVEVRHFALESYIAKRTPPLYDYSGAYLGQPEDVVATPAAYLRDHLIFNDTVKRQYQADGVSYITPHLPAMYNVLRGIDKAIDELNSVEGIINVAIPAFAARITDLEEQIAEFTAEIERLHNEILIKGSAINAAKELIELKKLLIEQKVKEIERLQEIIAELQDLVAQRNAVVNEWQDKLANTVKETCENYCPSPGPPGCGKWYSPPCLPSPCELICKVTQTWIDVNNQLQDAVMAYESAMLDLTANVLLKEAAERARSDAEIAIAAAEAEIKAAEAAIELATTLIDQHQAAREQARADWIAVKRELEQTESLKPAYVYPMRTLLTNWRRDVELAGEAYIGASGDVIKEVLREPTDATRLLKPLSDWLDCWGPVFGGVPRVVPNGVCAVGRAIDEIEQAIVDFRNGLGDLAWLIDPVGQLEQEIMQELKPQVAEAAARLAEKIGKQEMGDMVRLVLSPGVDEATLNSIFASDSTGRHLLRIGDVGARVNAEMHLTGAGYFDPERYRVVRNAIVLAKLTLLDPDELNQLYVDLAYDGVPSTLAPPTEYGSTLYTDSPNFNVLVGAIRSIDGNQQWQELGLPYPRLPGFSDPLWPVPGGIAAWAPPGTPAHSDTSLDSVRRRFGYRFCELIQDAQSCSYARGFRLWQDDTAREKVFKAIFQGPVAPGVEYPSELGFAELLPENYPFRACKQNPFPRTTYTDWGAALVRDALGEVRDNGCDEDFVVRVTVQPRGRNFLAEAVVTNQGARIAPATQVFFYLSTDSALDATDTLIGQRNIRRLAAEDSMSVIQAIILPPSVPAGTYYVIAAVDPLGVAAEAHEDNNQFVIAISSR